MRTPECMTSPSRPVHVMRWYQCTEYNTWPQYNKDTAVQALYSILLCILLFFLVMPISLRGCYYVLLDDLPRDVHYDAKPALSSPSKLSVPRIRRYWFVRSTGSYWYLPYCIIPYHTIPYGVVTYSSRDRIQPQLFWFRLYRVSQTSVLLPLSIGCSLVAPSSPPFLLSYFKWSLERLVYGFLHLRV